MLAPGDGNCEASDELAERERVVDEVVKVQLGHERTGGKRPEGGDSGELNLVDASKAISREG